MIYDSQLQSRIISLNQRAVNLSLHAMGHGGNGNSDNGDDDGGGEGNLGNTGTGCVLRDGGLVGRDGTCSRSRRRLGSVSSDVGRGIRDFEHRTAGTEDGWLAHRIDEETELGWVGAASEAGCFKSSLKLMQPLSLATQKLE